MRGRAEPAQTLPASVSVQRRRGFVEQRIDLRVAEVAAVEADRRRLRRVEHAAEDVGIGQRAAGPLQEVELEVARDDVGEERRELVGAHVERDAHARRSCWTTAACSRLNSMFDIFSVSRSRGAGPSPSGSG